MHLKDSNVQLAIPNCTSKSSLVVHPSYAIMLYTELQIILVDAFIHVDEIAEACQSCLRSPSALLTKGLTALLTNQL